MIPETAFEPQANFSHDAPGGDVVWMMRRFYAPQAQLLEAKLTRQVSASVV